MVRPDNAQILLNRCEYSLNIVTRGYQLMRQKN